MQKINEVIKKKYGNFPEKILQFGEGNFLRAFVDWMIDDINEQGCYQGSIVLCQPIGGNQTMKELINDQDGVYTLAMRGIDDGKPVERIRQITSVSRCINAYEDYEELRKLARSEELEVVVSNTTEAGIAYKAGDQLNDAPPSSFPAKVTALLYERYKAFNGDLSKGLLFLPVELIDNNGGELKKIVLRYAAEWELEQEFINWIHEANEFTSTLVDRIVTGYPRDQVSYFEEKLGYKDNTIVTSEVFNLWVIEGDEKWKDVLPVHKGIGNVIWTKDVTPYKKRKVRILNGGHTATVLAAFLAGHKVVLDFMQDEVFDSYLKKLLKEEVIPTIDLPKEELEAFAAAVGERFSNPYIKHNLLDIALNSCSKFQARCLPSILEYQKRCGSLPKLLSFAFAAFIKFYQCSKEEDKYFGCLSDGTKYELRDDREVLEFFESVWKNSEEREIAHQVLSHKEFWSNEDLTQIKGLEETVGDYLEQMAKVDIRDIAAKLIEQ